jgi:hypothetical protein
MRVWLTAALRRRPSMARAPQRVVGQLVLTWASSTASKQPLCTDRLKHASFSAGLLPSNSLLGFFQEKWLTTFEKRN